MLLILIILVFIFLLLNKFIPTKTASKYLFNKSSISLIVPSGEKIIFKRPKNISLFIYSLFSSLFNKSQVCCKKFISLIFLVSLLSKDKITFFKVKRGYIFLLLFKLYLSFLYNSRNIFISLNERAIPIIFIYLVLFFLLRIEYLLIIFSIIFSSCSMATLYDSLVIFVLFELSFIPFITVLSIFSNFFLLFKASLYKVNSIGFL